MHSLGGVVEHIQEKKMLLTKRKRKRPRGRPRTRWLDQTREDIEDKSTNMDEIYTTKTWEDSDREKLTKIKCIL